MKGERCIDEEPLLFSGNRNKTITFVSSQKMFHEDVVQVIRKRLEQEDDLPDERRPTALARSYYLKVLYDWKSASLVFAFLDFPPVLIKLRRASMQIYLCTFVFSSLKRFLTGSTARTQRCGTPVPKTYLCEWNSHSGHLFKNLLSFFSKTLFIEAKKFTQKNNNFSFLLDTV